MFYCIYGTSLRLYIVLESISLDFYNMTCSLIIIGVHVLMTSVDTDTVFGVLVESDRNFGLVDKLDCNISL